MLLTPGSLPILAWLNLLALPYTFYSIGYQLRHRNWCLLCCTIQAILWLECFCNLILTPGATAVRQFSPDTRDILTMLLSLLFPVATWGFLKPFFKRSAEVRPLQWQLKTFKYNAGLFEHALKDQPRYEVANDLTPVVMGNPEAETIITMVSNPFCNPCAKAHKTIRAWLSYRTDLQLKIVFSTSGHDNDAKEKIAGHICALASKQDQAQVDAALTAWYALGNKQYEHWAAGFPVDPTVEMNHITEKQRAWCKMADITFTPTILINGFKLPTPYRLEDIRYLLT